MLKCGNWLIPSAKACTNTIFANRRGPHLRTLMWLLLLLLLLRLHLLLLAVGLSPVLIQRLRSVAITQNNFVALDQAFLWDSGGKHRRQCELSTDNKHRRQCELSSDITYP
jgi:hypothetical protein